MSFSKREREALHNWLDRLIDARDVLEQVDTESLRGQPRRWYSEWSKPRGDFFKDGSLFLRSVIGEKLHYEEMSLLFEDSLEEDPGHADLMATISNAIRSYLPLFMEKGTDEYQDSDEVIAQIIDDFIAINWGDEPRFFTIYPRRQGQHKRLYRLNKLRLSALNWDKYLATVGIDTRKRHRIISDAYKTDWDAIRKWASIVESQYGFRSWPPTDADAVRAAYTKNPESILAKIRLDGAAYWKEKSAAGSGKEYD